MWFKMKFFRLKASYFLSSAGSVPFEIFLPTILRQIGYSTFTIGVIFTTLPIIAILATLVVGGIADKYKMRRSIFLTSFFLRSCFALLMCYVSDQTLRRRNVSVSCLNETAFSACDSSITDSGFNRVLESLPGNETVRCRVNCESSDHLRQEICSSWMVEEYCKTLNSNGHKSADTEIVFDGVIPIQRAYVQKDENYECLVGNIDTVQPILENETYLPRCYRNTSATCDMKCDDDHLNNLINSFFGIFGYFQFWMIFIAMMLYTTNETISIVFADAVCYSVLGSRTDLYGNQRVLGALSYGSMALIEGYLIDLFSDGTYKNYDLIWYLAFCFYALNLVNISKIKVVQDAPSKSVTKGIGKVLIRGPAIVFAGWCFYLGFTSSLIKNFLYIHLEDLSSPSEHVWIKTLQGSVGLVAAIPGEVPFFLLSGWIIKKLGHVNCMSLVIFGMCIRLLAYSILVRPIWALPIGLLHGVTFGLFFSVMTSYTNLIALPGTKTTSQGLFYSIIQLGKSCGSFAGGLVYENYKGSMMFRIFGVLTSILLVVHLIINFYYHYIETRNKKKQQIDSNGITKQDIPISNQDK